MHDFAMLWGPNLVGPGPQFGLEARRFGILFHRAVLMEAREAETRHANVLDQSLSSFGGLMTMFTLSNSLPEYQEVLPHAGKPQRACANIFMIIYF